MNIRNTNQDELDFVIKLESSRENRKNVFQWSGKNMKKL